MSAPSALHVRFDNLDREAPCTPGDTLFQVARRSAIRVVGACGGRGVCGTCMVRLLWGEADQGVAESRITSPSSWLRACQLWPLTDCVVEIAPRSTAPIVRTEVDGHDPAPVKPAPAVTVYDVALAQPALADARADADRLLTALRATGARRVDPAVLRALSPLLREHGWSVRAAVRGDEVIGVYPTARRTLGLAIDLGTTNVAGFLLDLESGTTHATLGIENPQAGYGADLVSRMNHAIRVPAGSEDLRTAAGVAISELARNLCEAVNARPDEIADVTVCGNTVMHHALLGLPLAQLGRSPFVPVVQQAVEIKARELGLDVAPGACVHLLPNAGGFVGGDHVAALLATEQRWRLGTTIVMDIGTNTEISLIHRGRIRTVSCPSGPAFEGGHISTGMRAAEGAIERVRVAGDRLAIKTIGHAAPVGLCGSGVLDAMAALLASGRVDQRGALRPCTGGGSGAERAVAIAPRVTFTQGDVRAVQLAKAAIRSGIDLLLRECGLAERDLDQVVIAGAFGTYINLESAVAIGMLPPLPRERFVQVGNAAGVGVRMALASTVLRDRASRLAAECEYIELGTLPGFQQVFLRNIGFERPHDG